jgi:hypothetical protein
MIRFFRVPRDLYKDWRDYARSHNYMLKTALAKLLKSQDFSYTSRQFYELKYDETKMHKKDFVEFHLIYTKELKEEIFKIFIQTHLTIGSDEFRYELLGRLMYALSSNQ